MFYIKFQLFSENLLKLTKKHVINILSGAQETFEALGHSYNLELFTVLGVFLFNNMNFFQ